MTDSKFIDSSAWLSYFYATSEEIKSVIESNNILFTSSITIYEIKKKLTRDKIENIRLQRLIDFIKKRSLIINLDLEIAEKAVEISIKNSLHTTDALIYSSALINNSILITLDNDFRNLDKVIIIKN